MDSHDKKEAIAWSGLYAAIIVIAVCITVVQVQVIVHNPPAAPEQTVRVKVETPKP